MSGAARSNRNAVRPRDLARLLKVLEAFGGSGAPVEQYEDRVRLTHRGKVATFPASLVSTCQRDHLVEHHDSGIVLTPEGRAALRRLLHPEAGYLAQHGELSGRRIELPDGPVEATVNEGESPLTRLRMRRTRDGGTYLSNAQFAAGERLRSDFERGRLRPSMSASWETPVSGGGGAGELSDFALDARRRVERALETLEPSLAGVCVDVCCFLKGLEQVEGERGWPPRSAKLMLRTALTILAAHYGLDARADARPRPLLHWGDAGYRPSL